MNLNVAVKDNQIKTSWKPSPCMAEGGCKKEGRRIIFIGNAGYPICDEHYRWLGEIGQLILKDWTKEKK